MPPTILKETGRHCGLAPATDTATSDTSQIFENPDDIRLALDSTCALPRWLDCTEDRARAISNCSSGTQSPRRDYADEETGLKESPKGPKSLFGGPLSALGDNSQRFLTFDFQHDIESSNPMTQLDDKEVARPSGPTTRDNIFFSAANEPPRLTPSPVMHSTTLQVDGLDLDAIQYDIVNDGGSEDMMQGLTYETQAGSVGLSTTGSRNASPESSFGIELPARIRKELREKPYDLRENVERNRCGTWIDVDQSGDFDPAEETRKRNAEISRARARERRKKAKDLKKAKDQQPKLIFRRKFKKFGNVINRTDGEDNWPEGWSDVDSQEERELERRRTFYRQDTPGLKPQVPILDPAQKVDDLTGHPEARSCKKCRVDGNYCSMMRGSAWPCENCKHEKSQCSPIVAPEQRIRCNHCAELAFQDDSIVCSFEGADQGSHAVCEQCVADDRIDCAPNMPEGYRTRLVDLHELTYGSQRPNMSCTTCKLNGKTCSVREWTQEGPCRQCEEDEVFCTFFVSPKKGGPPATTKNTKGKKKVQSGKSVANGRSSQAGVPRDRSTVSEAQAFWDEFNREYADEAESMEIEREPTPDIEMEDAQGNKGILGKLDTCFAHPIQFNSIIEEASACDFCELPIFAFVGHFEKTVHVLKWHNDLGYSELQGGHREESTGPTVMCQVCTMQRVQKIMCETHDIRAMDDAEVVDHDTAVDELLEATSGEALRSSQGQNWCSLCFSLASFRCCQPQPNLLAEDEAEESWVDGCGLRLCHDCEAQLRIAYNGSVDHMATAMELKPKAKNAEESASKTFARADVGFLRQGGLLMTNVENAAV